MTKSKGLRVRRGTRQIWVKEQQGKHFCGCGCGGAIPLKSEHFNVGIPQYLHGHNAKVTPPKPRKAVPVPKFCGCGCGELATPGRTFLSGHNTRGLTHPPESGSLNPHYGKRAPPRGEDQRGADVATWKGGRTMNNGYVEVRLPEHPYASNGYVREHRLVAEIHLREAEPTSEFLTPQGYLSPGADVHHVNEVKHDNRLENLQVMWRGDHTRHHLPALIAARWPKEKL